VVQQMFTGIITHTGKVQTIAKQTISFRVPKTLYEKSSSGDSVSVNGVCLTISKKEKNNLHFDIMSETLKVTNLKAIRKGSIVNLELAATTKTFLSGHIVQGHVDGVGRIMRKQKIEKTRKRENNKTKKHYVFTIQVPKNVHGFLVPKGSIAVNGISLTIIKVIKNGFTVGIIPHTLENTNLKNIHVGDKVNIEIDIVGKYIYSYLKNNTNYEKNY